MDGSILSNAWVEVARLSDIPRLGSRVVATAKGDVALFRTAGACPHRNVARQHPAEPEMTMRPWGARR